MKRIFCLMLCAVLLFCAAAAAETTSAPTNPPTNLPTNSPTNPPETLSSRLLTLLRQARSKELKEKKGDPDFTGKLFIAVFKADEKLDPTYTLDYTSLSAAEKGEDFRGIIPASSLASSLDKANTLILIYRTVRVVGHYVGGGAAKRAYTVVSIIDMKTKAAYPAYTAYKGEPPQTINTFFGKSATGEFKPDAALTEIAEKLAYQKARAPFKKDYAEIDNLLKKRLNKKLKEKSGKPSYKGKLVIAVYDEQRKTASTSLEALAQGKDFYSVPRSRLAKKLSAANTLVLVYPVHKKKGFYNSGGLAYSTTTYITVIDLKKKTQYTEVKVQTNQPPSRVTGMNQDHYGAYVPEKAMQQVVSALKKK